MICLRDYIGLRYCGTTTAPASGVYINDLPGISLRQVTSLTDEETSTFVELWNVVQKRSELRFATDARASFAQKYKIATSTYSNQIGSAITGTATASTGGFRGFTIELTDDEQYIPSPFTVISIQTLQFYASSGDATEVKEVAIFDIVTGEKLFTTNVTLASGWNTVQVNTKLFGTYNRVPSRVFCGINSTGLSLYDNEPPLYGSTDCCGVQIEGASTSLTTNITDADLTTASTMYGMGGVFSVGCAWDALVCNNKEPFTRAYMYLLGVELMTELLYSAKVNSYTTIDRAKMATLRDEFMAEYKSALDQTVAGFDIGCDCCVECSGQIQVVTSNSFF